MAKTPDKFPPERMMDTLYWWGVPSLFRCPVDPDPRNCDIALVGVPHSSGNGTTERDQHLGPRAVRHVSAHNRRMHNHFGFDPWTTARIHDLGDVPFPEAMDNEACVERMTEFYASIAKAGKPAVSIGGDHGITGGILQGLAGKGSKLTKGKPAALLHLDAHTDCFDNLDHWLGAKKSAAHWASYLVKEGHVDASKSVQIGMRGNTRTLDWLEGSRRPRLRGDRHRPLPRSRPGEMHRHHPGADRRCPALHHLRPRLPRSDDRTGRVESGSRRRGFPHERGGAAAAGRARPRT